MKKGSKVEEKEDGKRVKKGERIIEEERRRRGIGW